MIWEVVQEWSKCRDAMLPAIEATCGTHNEDNILAGLIGGTLKLWTAGASGLITDFSILPRMKCLNVFLAGGKMAELMPLRQDVIKFAHANGCARVTGVARPEWLELFAGSKSMGELLYMDL